MPLSEASPLEAFALLASGYVYVDVRSEPEFDEGRPRGAVNVPWRKFGVRGLEPNAAFVEDVRARFERDARIVVGCKFGDRARRAAAVLVEAGFNDVVVQRAGYDGVRDQFGRVLEAGWLGAGLPIDVG